MADFRPKLAAKQRFAVAMGTDALEDLPAFQVTAKWREENLLASAQMSLEGEIVDLNEPEVRADLEQRHAALLVKHGLEHLDLHEITARRRVITQAIAADLFHRGAAALRFPSRLDGQPAFALFEGRGELLEAGQPIALTDPAPAALLRVCEEWALAVEPTPGD